MNRLAVATSPYLLQHADNPVDWYEWGADAFAEAARRDVPLMISVGYAACHWCHVMAHESFEDGETAALLNASFVCVKVDREERPDVDAVYMTATQAMTGQGGWPMTVFATPDGRPFHCGTYFPPEPRHGMPSFRQVCEAVTNAWRTDRARVDGGSAQIAARLAEVGAASARNGATPPAGVDLAAAVSRLATDYDAARGGFGGAPKFPPSMTIEQLLRHHARTGDAAALAMARGSCEAMARGGIFDQVGGGFARYSVDADWIVPHFEKMLYDNAQLLRAYTHLWQATREGFMARIAVMTAEWLLREMRTPEGGFASSLDADSEGREGAFYVWTPEQLAAALGPDDGARAAEIFGVTQRGTFEAGASVLRLPVNPPDDEYVRLLRALLAARERRVRPGRDDKVVAAWNGLVIGALAEFGVEFGLPEYVDAAVAAAAHLLGTHLVGGRLRRTSREGAAGANAGVLEDYGCVADGLLTLYAVTGERRWFSAAGDLLDVVLERFVDGDGRFHDTADDAEVLLFRPADPSDNASPSGTSAAAGALLTYAAYTGSARHRAAAERALAVVGPLATEAPRFTGWSLAVAEALADGPREVAIVGPVGGDLHRAALTATAPGLAVAVGEPGAEPSSELLRDRTLVDGLPAAYVCRGFVCDLPTTDPAALAERLRPAEAVAE